MTREEAIEVFNKPAKHIGLYNGKLTYSAELFRAFEMAIEAMQTQLKESPEDFNKDSATEYMLNADLIDRQAVLDILDRHTLSRMALYEIEDLPSVQPQTVGKWIKTRIRISSGDFTRGVKCSKCGYETIVDDFKYCPNCGNQKMEGSGANDSGASDQNPKT